jgi:hypothetical protein
MKALIREKNIGYGRLRGRSGWMHVAVLLAILCGAERSNAQRYLGALGGLVSDKTGASVVGAKMTAVASATQFTTSVFTDKDGSYLMPALQPGTYSITVTAAGFREERHANVVLTAGQTVEVDMTLTPGNVTETVQVTSATSSLMDTTSPNLATTLTEQQVTDLPSEGRNPYSFTYLAPGVVGTSGSTGDLFSSSMHEYQVPYGAPFTSTESGGSIGSGSSTGHNRLTLDGIPNDPTEREVGPEYIGFVPSPEAIQEVKIENGVFDAQIGHGDGFLTNTVLRTGTNRLHGAAYYIFQDTYLNANTYQDAGAGLPRGNDQVDQAGLVLDGPVYIPKLYDGRNKKTYFMFAFERYATHTAKPYDTRVPTQAELGGDFSALCSSFNSSGLCTSGVQLYDPLSPVDAQGNRTTYFPNNNIASRISATGAAYAAYFPSPNVPGATALTIPNYIATQISFPSTYPSFIGRFDQAIGQRNKLSVLGFRSGLTQSQPLDGFHKGIGPDANTVSRNNRGGSVDDVQQFSNAMVLDSRLGLVYHPFGEAYPGSSGFNLSSLSITANGLPYSTFPGETMSDNYPSLASGASGEITTDTMGSLAETLTKVWGRHSVSFGWEGDIIRYNLEDPQSGFGAFGFDRRFTQQNVNDPVGSEANSGNSMASMLLGDFSSAVYSINFASALQQIYSAVFVQDDWRVNRKLTLNLGGRWDYESPNTERYNRMNSNFCTACVNPLQASVPTVALNGGLEFVNSADRFPYPRDLHNWQPRLGAEYALRPDTVVRAGFGIIYFNTMETPFTTGYSQSTSYTNTSDGAHPINSMTNPFPTGVTLPSGSSLGLSTGIGQSINFNDPHHVQPRTADYTVSVQHQFAGNFALQIAYFGSRVTRLEVSHDINFLPAQYYNLGQSEITYLNKSVPNPMAGYIPGNATINGSTIEQNRLLYPYPEFGAVNDNYVSIGSSPYNSLQIQVSHPMNHHFTVGGNFTWDKLMTHNSYLNPFDTHLASIQDTSATLSANVFGTLVLPRFQSRPYWLREILGGWKLNSVFADINGTLNAAPSNVNIIGHVEQAHPTYARYINTCYENTSGQLVSSTASAPACDSLSPVPAYQQRLAYTSQVNSPNIDVRTRVHPRVDASLFKQFPIRASMTFEIRGEFFNILNTPNFAGANTTIGSSNFGAVTLTQANDPRIGQLTARFNF